MLLADTGASLTLRTLAASRPLWYALATGAVLLVLEFGFFLITPRLLLDLPFAWRDLVPGAAICTVANAVVHAVAVFFLRNWFGEYGNAYGGFGIGLALIAAIGIVASFWVWIAAVWASTGNAKPDPPQSPPWRNYQPTSARHSQTAITRCALDEAVIRGTQGPLTVRLALTGFRVPSHWGIAGLRRGGPYHIHERLQARIWMTTPRPSLRLACMALSRATSDSSRSIRLSSRLPSPIEWFGPIGRVIVPASSRSTLVYSSVPRSDGQPR